MAQNQRPTGSDEALDRATSLLGEDDGSAARAAGRSPREGETDPPRGISGLAASVQPGGAPDEPGAIVSEGAVTGDETSGGVGAGPAGRGEGASLRHQSADQIRNVQRGGLDAPPNAAEGNDTLKKVWSDPGGEAYNYRNALVGAGGKADDHTDAVEAETPAETVRHLSDPTLSPQDRMRRPKPSPAWARAAATRGDPMANKPDGVVGQGSPGVTGPDPAATRKPETAQASETALENTLQGGRAGAPADSEPAKNVAPASESRPAAGPHADPSLINPDATPGAGSLPDIDSRDVDGGSS